MVKCGVVRKDMSGKLSFLVVSPYATLVCSTWHNQHISIIYGISVDMDNYWINNYS